MSRVSRRVFLQASGVASLGTLTGLPVTPAVASQPVKTAPRAAIVLCLTGGPSQIDTWDPKPDAPQEVRGPFAPITTSVPGVFISELFPRLAQRMHKVQLVRSLHHEDVAIHETGFQRMLTGRREPGKVWPHFGAVVAKQFGPTHADVLANVIFPAPLESLGTLESRGQDAGFLPEMFGSATSEAVSHLLQHRSNPADGAAYGTHAFGRNCHAARQLIEAGVRVCTVNHFQTVFHGPSWDMHANGAALPTTLTVYRDLVAPQFDQAYSALLDDLEARGLLSETVVAVVSEMGRTPFLNARGGRDHWTGVWTNLLAGGGVEMGTVLGASDRLGGAPVDQPVSPDQFLAKLLSAMRINPHMPVAGPQGEFEPWVHRPATA